MHKESGRNGEPSSFLNLKNGDRDQWMQSAIGQFGQFYFSKNNVKLEVDLQCQTYAQEVVMAGILLGILSEHTQGSFKNNLKSFLSIVSKRYGQIGYVQMKNQDDNSKSHLSSVFVKQSSDLQHIIAQFFSRCRYHRSGKMFSKYTTLTVLKCTSKAGNLIPYCLSSQQEDPLAIFGSISFQSFKTNPYLTQKAKIYVYSIFQILFLSQIIDFQSIEYFQRLYVQQLRKILTQKILIWEEWNIFINDLFMCLNLKISLLEFKNILLGKQFQSTTSNKNIFNQLYELIGAEDCQMNDENATFDSKLTDKINQIRKSTVTLQNLIDMLANMLTISQENQSIGFQQEITPFNKLSLILFDKINLRPIKDAKPQKLASFIAQSQSTKICLCKKILRKLYECDLLLKSNPYLMNSFPQNQANNGQKLIVTGLKKYYNIYYNRINQVVIRKWIISRNYLLIWSMFLCNYKVKSICEQLLKCGLRVDEFCSFFKLQQCLIKQFIQFLINKDKYKFRLALWNQKLLHKEYLLEYSFWELLV